MTRRRLALATTLWCVVNMFGMTASADEVPSPLFDPTIIDLALDVDEPALASLREKPDTAVPATLTLKTAAEGDHIYQVMAHIKGQLGSARAVDDKPASSQTTSGGTDNGMRISSVSCL